MPSNKAFYDQPFSGYERFFRTISNVFGQNKYTKKWKDFEWFFVTKQEIQVYKKYQNLYRLEILYISQKLQIRHLYFY